MKDKTKLIHRHGDRHRFNTVNPPIERASTLLISTRETLQGKSTVYGRMGLSVHRELEAAMCDLESADYAFLTSNGLQACALASAALVKAGDHVLYADCLYGPNRRFCQRRLRSMGVTSTRFSARIGQQIETLIQPETRLIILESPGSLTFELVDLQAIVEVARAHNIITVFDNTWGAGVFHRPLELGVDVVVQALTKYVVGHADTMAGAVMTRSTKIANQIERCKQDWGFSLSPDDAYTALRGLRTLHVRLRQHEANGYALAEWLANRPEIDRVLHPGRADHPDHHLWQRDFSGACGLFGAIMAPIEDSQLDRFLESMTLFKMGFSWGGFESLLIPCCDQLNRLSKDPIHDRTGPLLRIHAGLEDIDDLTADLAQAFAQIER